MSLNDQVSAAVKEIATAGSRNKRVAFIRGIPEEFGIAHHQTVYAAVAKAIHVAELTPDFAYVHWRKEYELSAVEEAYSRAHALTSGFADVDADTLAKILQAEPVTLRVFRLLLGFTTQEFAASTVITADQLAGSPLSNSAVKTMEGGKPRGQAAARVAAAAIDQAMRGELFVKSSGEVRSKISKPDTGDGWNSVRKYAAENVPFPVFLHQRHYGGAFGQLLNATSGKRGDLLEDAVDELFSAIGSHLSERERATRRPSQRSSV